MIICLYGQPGSGKTTLSNEIIANGAPVLRYARNLQAFFPIDGDKLRETTENHKYDKGGRIANMTTAIDIALYASSVGYAPIISMVMPYEDMRLDLEIRAKCPVFFFELYCEADSVRGKEKYHVEDFETSKSATLINTTKIDLNTSFKIVMGEILSKIIK